MSALRINLLILFVFLFPTISFCISKQTEQQIDSLKLEIRKAESDTDKVKILDKLAYKYSKLDPEQGLKYAVEAKNLSEKAKWKKGLAVAWLDIGMNQAVLSNNKEALLAFENALTHYEDLSDKKGISSTYSNIGLLYKSQSNYPKALEYSFKAIKYKDFIPERSLAIQLENIGTIYLEQLNYAKTISYYNEALAIYEKLGDKAGIARNLGNNGIVQDAKGNFKQALASHKKALAINEELGNDNGIQINYGNIGLVYSHLEDYEKAIFYQEKALQISEKLKVKTNIAINTGNLGETYYLLATKDETLNRKDKQVYLTKGINYLENAVELCKKINFAGPQLEFTQFLANSYASLNDFEKAYKINKESQALKELTQSEESKIEIKKLEAQHEIDLKNKDLLIKDKELLIEKLAAENKKRERTIWIVMLCFIVLIGLYIVYRLIQRTKRQKHTLNDIAHIQAHDMRGPVASILGLVSMFNQEDVTDPLNADIMENLKRVSVDLDNKIKDIVLKTVVDEE